MNNEIFNSILITMILVVLLLIIIIKNRVQIIRFIKKNQVIRFIANVFIPFVVPLALSIVFAIQEDLLSLSKEDSLSRFILISTIVLLVIATLNLVVQLTIWFKEKKEENIQWENFAAGQAFNNMYEVFMGKMIQLRASYHNGLKQGMLTDADIPYNIFDQIRKITWEFCRTVSKITDIPTKDLDAAFIYHYTYKGATDEDKKWKWITGKGSKFSLTLNNFVDNTDSTFHHMINNNVSTLFYNDKNIAANKQKYQYTYKDHNHNCIGSFVAAKVAFSGNDDTICEGIIMINSYGKRFLDSTPQYTEDEIMHLILDSIFPCYRQLLSAELAMLYFRHQTDEPTEWCKEKPIFQKDSIYNKKSLKCLITTTKKIWRKK